ncbi:putative serine incorporator [Oculina patagonica]
MMAVCDVPSLKPKHGRLIYIGFILFGVLMSTLTFIPAFRRFFVVHSNYCSRNTSQGKCDILVGHILLYRFYIGMILFFLILAIINCQLTVFSTFSHWLENGFWFIKFHLFCLSILLSLLIPEGHLSNAVMHVGWIGSFIVMIIQLVLIIDLAKTFNAYWVERMELSTRPNAWYLSMLLVTSLLYTLSLSFVVYFYATYAVSMRDCRTNLIFITAVVVLCIIASLLSIHPKVRETGLLQAGIVTSYSVYFAWTCMLHYPYSACNPTWSILVVTEFNFHLQFNMIFDLFVTFALLVYDIVRVPSVQHLLATINLMDCCMFQSQVENNPESPAEDDERPLVASNYLMFYLFLILICLHLLMTISNFYTPEGIVGTEDEVVESEYKLIDMDQYVKSLSQWVASCLKMIVCVVFLLMYMWTILAPVILPH